MGKNLSANQSCPPLGVSINYCIDCILKVGSNNVDLPKFLAVIIKRSQIQLIKGINLISIN